MTTATDVLNEVNALRGDMVSLVENAEEATASALAAASQRPKSNYNQYLYIDPVNGVDSAVTPVADSPAKSLKHLLNTFVEPGTSVIIRLLNDYVLEDVIYLNSPPAYIRIDGWSSVTNTYVTDRKITRDGGIITVNSPCVFNFSNIDIDIGGAAADHLGVFHNNQGKLTLLLSGSVISKTGLGHLVFTYNEANLTFGGVTIEPAAEGSIVYGVAAGADPNAKHNVTANFTSA